MRSLILLTASVLLITSASAQKINIKDVKKKAEKVVQQKQGGEPGLSNDEVISGLKEALTVGTNNSSSLASKADGFYKNPAIMIPFPPEAMEMKKKLEKMGMKKQVDEFVMTLNRAAEEAAKDAAPVFTNAIKGMSVGDGFAILKGADSAATGYLKEKTSGELHDKFKPTVAAATKKVDVTKYWTPLVTTYNKLPGVTKQNPDLDEYVTQRALQGLFKMIAEEEKKIRKDPAARVTDILKKVFK
jgi:hypothetical protein